MQLLRVLPLAFSEEVIKESVERVISMVSNKDRLACERALIVESACAA